MAKRHGIYFDESGNLVVNPHPDALRKPGTDAHQSVMTAGRSRWDDDRGTISARHSDIPRDTTLIDFLKTGRNLRRGEYAKTFNTMLAVAGMFAGAGGRRRARGTKWYSDLSRRYGERRARQAADFVESPEFVDYFWQGNPVKVRRDAAAYANVRDIINRIGGDPDSGRAVVGGSMSINKTGTLQRPTAVVHDLDIAAYTANASKVPWEPYPFPLNPKDPNGVAPGWYDRFVAPVEDWRRASENAPILQLIRKAFPESHGNARILPWDWKSMKMDSPEDRYKTGVFQQIGDGYSTSRTAGNNIFLGTRINGVPIDLFLTDSKIERVPGTVYAPPEVAFTWKNSYADDGGTMRPKDSRDFLAFRRFSAANPVVDPSTKRAQFSPVNFGDELLTEEGLPAVYDVETWPGSAETVPMIMNTKGKMVYPFDMSSLREDARGGDVRSDARGGDDRFARSRNFLARDDVPDTLFGFPVVAKREDYTPEDLAFFRKHPEAGGYYDLGDEEETSAPSLPATNNMSAPGGPAQTSEGRQTAGPRIVINPSTFRNEKDALCVAYNEGFRILMELNGFEPMAEPTGEQRKFFSDTAYAKDELQLRRTILARIATFDTSVKDPTEEQLQETAEFLHTVLEIGAPQSEEEQAAVQRLLDGVEAQVSSTPTTSSSETTR